MSDQYVEPVTLPLLVVDMIRYYRQFYFGDKIIIMYSGEYSDKRVVGIFDNAYSIINKMIIETKRVYIYNTSHNTIQHKNIKILGWYLNYSYYSGNNQLFLSFPIELLTSRICGYLTMVYIDSGKEARIGYDLEWFNLNDICYGDYLYSSYINLPT